MTKTNLNYLLDATKNLGCAYCVDDYNCKRYSLICDYQRQHFTFTAKLLCTLEIAKTACSEMQSMCVKRDLSFTSERANNLFKNFLAQINNELNAIYEYELENATEYQKRALFIALGSTLEEYDCLEVFDFIYNQNVKQTFEMYVSQSNLELAE